MAFSNNLPTLETIIGNYFRGHFARWRVQLPFWGILILTSVVLSLTAAKLLWQQRKEGGYVGIAAFGVGFVTNILFARNILVHSLIGWTLLAPVAVAWKNLT